MMDRDEIVDDMINSYPKSSLLFFASKLGIVKCDKKTKGELAEEVVSSLTQLHLFNRFLDSLSLEGRKVLYYLTWYGITTLKHIEEFYSISLTLGDFYGNSDDPFIKAIKSYNSKEVFLSTGLRTVFKRHLEPPQGYNLEYSEIDGEYISGGDGLFYIEEDISYFLNEENLINFPQEKRILKRTTTKFLKRYKIPEEKRDGGETLLKLLSLTGNDFSGFQNLLKRYISGTIDPLNIDELLFYKELRGISSNYAIRTFLKRGRYSAISVIRDLEINRWISISNLVLFLVLREDTEIFDTSYFGSSLYRKGERGTPVINKIDLCLIFIEPLVIGIVNLLNILGGVDLKKSGDKIEYIRLNSRGSKLFGRVKPNSPSTLDFKYNPLSSATIIETNGVTSPIKDFFQRVGNKIGEKDYIITPQTFFKNASDINDVEINLGRLRELTGSRDAWSNLFNEIENRIEPLYNEQELIVVNLPMENSSFVNEVMENPSLSNLFSIVEGGRVAFTRENYMQFKKSVRKIGYFIN